MATRTFAALAVALGFGLTAAPAVAQEQPVTGGDATWSFKDAIRAAFPVDPPDNFNFNAPNDLFWQPFGTTTRVEGVQAWRFPATGGTVDVAAGEAHATFSGGLRIGYCVGGFRPVPEPPAVATTCPPAGPVASGIYVVFSDLTVDIDGASGTLSGNSWAGFHGGAPAAEQRRAFGALDLTGITPQVSGNTVTYSGVKVTLTEEGAPLGLGQYPAGTPLDPIDITFQVEGGEEPEPTPSVSEDVTVTGDVAAALGLTIDSTTANLGAFQPGVGANYDATLAATATATGASTLTVVDEGAEPGYLLNDGAALDAPLGVRATHAAAPTADYTALAGTAKVLTGFAGSVSAEPVTIGLRQAISASEPLVPGTYGKTLTFTLAAGTP